VSLALATLLAIAAASTLAWALAALRTRARSRTEREQLDAALQASEAVSAALSEEALFLSAVLSAVDTAIVIFDRTGRVRFVNDRFAAFFGVATVEVVGHSLEALHARIAGCFVDPEAFRRLAELEERRRVSEGQPMRVSGAVVADEAELAISTPKPRTLRWSTRPVVQVAQRVGVLSMFRDVTRERAAEAAREQLLLVLAEQARTDALTALANRRAATEALATELERARRYQRPLSIVIFDLDHFKDVNDRHGHEAGDKMLIAFAEVLKATARGTDVVSRWGGEEFLAIVFEAEADAACAFAERVRAELRDRAPLSRIGGDRSVLTVSAGVATLGPEDDAETLLRRADRALYEAKESGRDRTRCAA
jgi:diguanylate cyclase (GGDEF)-like protein/PAS domain S-box-containing protein